MSDINFLGRTNFRNEEKRFGIKLDDRRRHLYVIGKTGMGKTQLLLNMAVQDIRQGRGLGFVDPHGEAAEALLDFVPKERIKDVIYFNPADRDFPISFNVMENVAIEQRHLVASGLMGVFKKIWPDVWSARMEYILNNALLALLEHPSTTLLGINRMLVDIDYRQRVVEGLKDPVVRAFWEQEFSRYSQRYEVEATAAIQNKIGQFISSPLIRNIIGQKDSSIDMRDIMDNQKIFIMNLSKGRVGEDSSKLLGGLLITKLQLAAMSRVDIPEEERKDFFLYVDEFQNFATESFANILSEARKYRLCLILGHQYISQMEETVGDAVFGNVGTIITFRVGAEDAEFLEREFAPDFVALDLVNLPKYHIYLKLMIDGVASNPFSAKTLPPFQEEVENYRNEIIQHSRSIYATYRDKVEEKIALWSGSFTREGEASHNISSAPNLANQQPQTEMYEIVCQRCHQPSRVPFKPEPGRAVFCKPCKKEIDKENQAKRANEKSKQEVAPAQPRQKEKKEKKENLPLKEETKIPPELENEQAEDETFSLEELLMKKPINFTKKKQEKSIQQKANLKQQIKDSLRDTLKQEGELKPGEVVEFE
ncbi:MAG: type IV secretion system DNA-binding domain-containing protein [bacterium]|nr:type IV secretion system DNA-binding domain-containing protein [bacterium]